MDNNEVKIENPANEAPAKKPKKKPEAEILLDRQLEMKGKTRKTDIAILASFCAFILFFGVAFFIIPDKKHSETENRDLAQMPSLSFESIKEDLQRDLKLMTMTDEEKKPIITELEKKAISENYGSDGYKFSGKISKYYADQFPFRDQLRVIKAAVEIGMFKQENNDVVFAGEYLIKKDTVSGTAKDENGTTRNRTYEDAVNDIKENVGHLRKIEECLPDNVDLRVSVGGRTVDVASSKLPAVFPYESTHADLYWDAYYGEAKEKDLSIVELKDMLRAHFENGEYVAYKTDHHWTSLGAYYAYCEIVKSYGIEPYPLDDFKPETFTTSFVGTTFAKAGAAFGGKDTIELFRYEGDTDYTTAITVGDNVTTTLQGFYNPDKYRNVHDKYGVFIGGSTDADAGGNNSVTTVTKNGGEKRPKLLLIKDSFGNSIVPFLARHFDLVVFDMRTEPQPSGDEFSKVLSDEDLEHILVLYNMETFMNDAKIFDAAARIIPYYKNKMQQ